jgi:hypothetical protein
MKTHDLAVDCCSSCAIRPIISNYPSYRARPSLQRLATQRLEGHVLPQQSAGQTKNLKTKDLFLGITIASPARRSPIAGVGRVPGAGRPIRGPRLRRRIRGNGSRKDTVVTLWVPSGSSDRHPRVRDSRISNGSPECDTDNREQPDTDFS